MGLCVFETHVSNILCNNQIIFNRLDKDQREKLICKDDAYNIEGKNNLI